MPDEPQTLETSDTIDPETNSRSSEQLLSQLLQVYRKRQKEGEFEQERKTYELLIPGLVKRLGKAYTVEEPTALGSTATVWVVYDTRLKQRRALKLARPRFYKLEKIILVLRGESDLLAKLNHQNIIKIYGSDEVELTLEEKIHPFPFYIMEYFDEIDDLDDYILKNLDTLEGDDIVGLFRDLLSGIAFIHQQSVIHCDIKPGNLLVAPGKRALVADLGYAKALRIPEEETKLTYVSYTPPYAHPRLQAEMIDSQDSAANIAELERDKLDKAFDLFAFGRSMQEVLRKIRDAEKSDPKRDYGRKSKLSPYQWNYLGYVSKRLLDGVVERNTTDELISDVIPRLPNEVMGQLKYLSADEAHEDLEKLLHLYDLEGEIPELNPNLSSFVQVPHCQVPLTKRVQEVINHPTFQRLAQVTQLGFISLVYPGANHTRLEHVLGTFTHCCQYIRALWYDQANGLFQSVMSKPYLELGLIAALLHDIGQYPMAHDLTEIASPFAHETLTLNALLREDPTCDETLSQVLKTSWNIEAEDVISVINAGPGSDFRHRILKAIISGPLDCDKLDYLKRDSTHLGVSFGLSIDQERLFRNLTIGYESETRDEVVEGQTVSVRKLKYVELAVTEKALVVAQSLWRVRKDMFTQVYWQHTARTLKAMLGFVVRNILRRFDDDKANSFWAKFQEFVFSPLSFCNSAVQDEHTGTSPDFPFFDDHVIDFSTTLSASSHLSATDDALLQFLFKYANTDEREMIQAIRTRKVYRRFAVLSYSLNNTQYRAIYDKFSVNRDDLNLIEGYRESCEKQVREEALKEIEKKPYLIPSQVDADSLKERIQQTNPLVLVDVPIKGSGSSTQETIAYLPEDIAGIHSRVFGVLPAFKRKPVTLEDTTFDIDVGKIRVLAHPSLTEVLVRAVPDNKVFGFL